MGDTKHDAIPDGKRRVWQKTPTSNLVRYVPKGSYYIRARVRGIIVRESLKTTQYSVACFRAAERLRELRSAAGSLDDGPKTLAQALAVVGAQIKNDPSLKDSTRRSYIEELECLKLERPASVPTLMLMKITPSDMEVWWARTARAYSPQRANHLLRLVRRAIAVARERGSLFRDPTAKLKPVKIPRTRLNLPTLETFHAIVSSVRSQRKAHSEEAANWIEFMAYSGMRPGEIEPIEWRDIDLERGTIRVHGATGGTKNGEFRTVPIIPAMRALLLRMGAKGSQERVFGMSKPTEALRNACKRLHLPRMRIYDLRHLFASNCCARGVPVPTFAGWLGHKDGGALAMKTYVHPLDEHTKRAAELVKF